LKIHARLPRSHGADPLIECEGNNRCSCVARGACQCATTQAESQLLDLHASAPAAASDCAQPPCSGEDPQIAIYEARKLAMQKLRAA
jgi:hypothetical protein